MPKPLERYFKVREEEQAGVALEYPDCLEVHFPPGVDAALKKGTPFLEIGYFNTPLGRFMLRHKAAFEFTRRDTSIQQDVRELNQVEVARKKAEKDALTVWKAPHVLLIKAEHSLERAIGNNKKQRGVNGISRENDTLQELRQTQRQVAEEIKKLRGTTRELREQETRMKDHLELKVEGMVTCDQRGFNNVLGYALSHPKRKREVFARFSNNFQNPELAIKELEERYSKLKH